MNHTPECLERTEKIQAAIFEYLRLWPNYCRKCGGTGTFSWTENQSPLGSGLSWPETFVEPCEACLAQGHCPRCGGESEWLEEQEECPYCHWHTDGVDDSLPVQDEECDCDRAAWSRLEANLRLLLQESVIQPGPDDDSLADN